MGNPDSFSGENPRLIWKVTRGTSICEAVELENRADSVRCSLSASVVDRVYFKRYLSENVDGAYAAPSSAFARLFSVRGFIFSAYSPFIVAYSRKVRCCWSLSTSLGGRLYLNETSRKLRRRRCAHVFRIYTPLYLDWVRTNCVLALYSNPPHRALRDRSLSTPIGSHIDLQLSFWRKSVSPMRPRRRHISSSFAECGFL